MRLFLDANVLFTAVHNPRGKAAFVIEQGTAGHWEVLTSSFAVEEAQRNLGRKYPHSLDALRDLMAGIQVVEHSPGLRFPEILPAKDRPIFQAALACRATHLLTGDLEDFSTLFNRPEETFGVRIQTVADFLDNLLTAPVRTAK